MVSHEFTTGSLWYWLRLHMEFVLVPFIQVVGIGSAGRNWCIWFGMAVGFQMLSLFVVGFLEHDVFLFESRKEKQKQSMSMILTLSESGKALCLILEAETLFSNRIVA